MTEQVPRAAGGEASPPRPGARDVLAAERTRLANDRTLLAFIRTGIGVAAAGVTAGYAIDEPWALWTSRLLVFAGIAAFIVGVVRYGATQRLVRRALKG